MNPRRLTVLAELACLTLLAFAAFLVFSHATRWVPFQGDEANYLYRSRYFSYLFLRHDVSEELWGDDHHVHTQPMLANYIVGATLWLAGRDPEGYPAYIWRIGPNGNRREGRVPDSETLALIRGPMVWFGVGVVLLLYGLGRALGDPFAGLVAGAVGIASDLAQNAIPRARNDSPLVFFVLLALLLGVIGARRARHGGLPAAWAVAMGIALGLALESKLTATLSLAATIGWGGLVGLAAARRADRDPGTYLRAAWAAGRGWLAATLVAFAVLVVLNPHLWLNPLEHTAHLYVDRVEEMGALQMAYPLNAVYDVRERPVRVLLGSLVQGTWLGARRVPLEALLATVGFVTLTAKAARDWRLGRWPSAEGLLLTTVLAYFVGVSANLYVYWDTYLLPNLLLGAVLSGIGAHALISDPARGCVETIRARLARSSRRASESASPVGG